MNRDHFNAQIGRLINTYGKNGFPEERAVLLWREVQGYSDTWFTRTVDRLIGDCRQAPLMTDFRNAISEERERTWQDQKAAEKNWAKEPFNCFDDDDTRMICQTIIARMQRRVNDEQWEDLLRTIERMPTAGGAA